MVPIVGIKFFYKINFSFFFILFSCRFCCFCGINSSISEIMAYKDKEGEVYPLLTTDWLGCPTYRQKPVAKKIRGEDDIEPVIEDDDEVFDIIDQKKKRNVNLVWIDVALMALDYLQVYLYMTLVKSA